MPTRYDKEFKQNIINLYKQGESAAQLAREYGHDGFTIILALKNRSQRWQTL